LEPEGGQGGVKTTGYENASVSVRGGGGGGKAAPTNGPSSHFDQGTDAGNAKALELNNHLTGVKS